TFSITFKPSKAQQETATVTITSNDATNSPFVFTIIGEGTVPPPSGGGSTTPSTPSNPPTKQERLNISFGDNSSKEVIADVLDENNVRTTKIDLDEAQVPKKLDEMEKTQPDGEKKVIIPVNNHSDKVVGEMKASTLKKMADMNAVLEIKTENISYTLPASAVNIDDILTKIGGSTELKDITVKVEIVNTADSKAGQIKAAAAKSGFELEAAPVEFEITCTNSGREVTVSSFNSYVGRTVAIPDGVDPKKITTGVVYNADGSFSHVPTAVTILNGKYYAKINSLTNSTYTLIYNPLTFDDVENHWSKGYVNDAGSRLIVSGTGNGKFTPDRAVTRGEFAVMIVKALGLKGSQFADNFKDVGKDNPYYSYIYTAYQYGIIAGYSNTQFGSNDMITREQAMTMISKAMKIAGIDTAQSNTDGLNSTFTDSDTISGWAKEGAAICANSGLFVGSNGKLNPKNDITRAESATVAIKLLKKAHLI
ncbi:MAG TPA: S-layer homology domain-containing protein, partial [Ruminiclostridium sp.]|nr:S-layer homology domain-containing protein [Ruminiclostridium sp.]